MDFLDLPAVRTARGIVHLPGSKSISNRVLLLAALADGATAIRDVLVSEDTARMLDALQTLGVSIVKANDKVYRIQGISGHFPLKFPVGEASLFLAMRDCFPTLDCRAGPGWGKLPVIWYSRMHERPIGDLVDALRQLGADITYLGNTGFPPLEIKPAHILRPSNIVVRGDVSSQFLTGLLMAMPFCAPDSNQEQVITVTGELISRPYIELTIALMARFGMHVEHENWRRFTVFAGKRYLSPGEIFVEGDASSASYFLAAGAIGIGPVRVEGIGRDSLQGDVRFAEALEKDGRANHPRDQLDGSTCTRIPVICRQSIWTAIISPMRR